MNSMAWQFRLCGLVADDMPWIMLYRDGAAATPCLLRLRTLCGKWRGRSNTNGH